MLQPTTLLKTDPFHRCLSRIQVSVWSNISRGLTYSPATHMFDVLLVPKFTSTRRWKRPLKVFYKYKRPAINLSTVLFLCSHVWTPFGNTSLELYLWPTFVGVQRVTLPKTDHTSRYSLRMYVLMYCYDFAWS